MSTTTTTGDLRIMVQEKEKKNHVGAVPPNSPPPMLVLSSTQSEDLRRAGCPIATTTASLYLNPLTSSNSLSPPPPSRQRGTRRTAPQTIHHNPISPRPNFHGRPLVLARFLIPSPKHGEDTGKDGPPNILHHPIFYLRSSSPAKRGGGTMAKRTTTAPGQGLLSNLFSPFSRRHNDDHDHDANLLSTPSWLGYVTMIYNTITARTTHTTPKELPTRRRHHSCPLVHARRIAPREHTKLGVG